MIPLKVKQYHKLVLSQSHYQRCLQRSTKRCLTSSAIKHLSIMERSFKVKLSGRLSSLVRPVNYKLKLNPNLEDGTFKGNVEILVNVQEERSYLILHTSFLNIKQIKVFKDDDEIAITNFLEVKHLEQLVIHVADVLKPGKFKLKLDFTGDLTNKIVGFYSSTLGDKRTMVASKFQPTYARQAFPCFDEPEFKATYDITLEKPASYIALSNMNEVSSIHNEITNTDAVTFATSVPMSTYLACFVICDFDHKETTINTHGIGTDFTLRLFAQKGETHKINFALDIGKRATEFYIQYYEVPFPLPKLDMIAIPDYVSGATEHWGLITYRETSFLLDPATASSKNKMSVANVIAHELAHMWFGNLVTMKWWDEVWLNEGFATYMQVKSLNALEPTWTMLDQFLTSTLHPALVIDAKLSSHPIVQSVDTPDQITAIFDSISYKKGSSILRMLEGFVGAENFRNGILAYLTKHKFGNTVQQDLLASLTPFFHSDNAGLDLKYIMDTWTKQMGYPLLTVAEGTEPGTFIVTQKRFLLQPYAESKNDSEFNYRWYVPITYKTDKGESETVLWFSDKADNFKITLNDGVAWLKLNNNQVGYYRVNYSEDLWKKLIEVLKTEPNVLSISDRAHLINDVFSLAAAQVSPYPQALELLSYLSQETALVPWDAGAAVLEGLATKLHGDPAGYYLHRFVCDLVEPQYNKLSWERNDQQASVIDGLFRVRILQLATRFELPAAKSKAREMFLRWLNAYGTDAPITIEPDLRDIVYYYGMQQATMSEWDRLWQIYLEESDVHELTKLRYALAAPLNAQILQKYLDLAWDEKNVRGQDYFNVLQSIARNPVGESLVWNQVRQQWNKLVERFTLNSRYLGIMVQGITSGFKTEERLKQMETFFAQYPQAGAGAANRKAALETVYDKIAWTAHCEPSVTSWLHSHRDSRDPPSCGLAD